MIIRNGKPLAARYYGRRAVLFVYKGIKLIWQSIRSCFGSGKWIGNKPWIGKEKWKGTK